MKKAVVLPQKILIAVNDYPNPREKYKNSSCIKDRLKETAIMGTYVMLLGSFSFFSI